MSTPAYVPPYVGPAGLVINTYASILADNLQAFLNIYGQNQYIAPDSAIYQLLSILSLKQYDEEQALQLAYNQSSPFTAVGAGLDRQVRMNGLARLPYTFSTATLTLTGVAGTVVANGVAQDENGNLWALPTSVPIVGGSVNTLATCTTTGAVTAEPGTINAIATPTSGWTGVTNSSPAVTGAPVETDSELRARQAVSVALPGLTPIASTLAATLAIPGVTRVAPGYPTGGGAPGTSIENPTGSTDSWGNPAHSISLVVENGDTGAIGLAVYLKKTIGCLTNGTTSTLVTDPNTGYQETISFYRPTYLPIYVYCTIHGYSGVPTTAVVDAVQAAIVTYLAELAIGETVSYAALIYEAMAVNQTLTSPGFGVQVLLIGLATANTTATVTASMNTITVASNTGIANGQYVFGAGVTPGTTVTNVSGTTITLSANATASGTLVPLVFSTMSAADIPMTNYYYVALGAADTTFVATV